jgi:hypothetical protein
MSPYKPLLHGAGTVLAVVALGGLVCLAWAGLLGGDLGDLAGRARVLEEEQQRQRDLEAREKALFACMAGKDQVAREVAAGHLSLVEGAARFRALCRDTPGFSPALFHRIHGGSSDEECYCRALIDQVWWVLADHPAQAQETAWRLEVELEVLLNYGTRLLSL